MALPLSLQHQYIQRQRYDNNLELMDCLYNTRPGSILRATRQQTIMEPEPEPLFHHFRITQQSHNLKLNITTLIYTFLHSWFIGRHFPAIISDVRLIKLIVSRRLLNFLNTFVRTRYRSHGVKPHLIVIKDDLRVWFVGSVRSGLGPKSQPMQTVQFTTPNSIWPVALCVEFGVSAQHSTAVGVTTHVCWCVVKFWSIHSSDATAIASVIINNIHFDRKYFVRKFSVQSSIKCQSTSSCLVRKMSGE